MRTEDDDEIVEPGVYDLGDDKRLHVWLVHDLYDPDAEVQMWACTAYDHGPFCRLCQQVDGVLNALLVNVIDGHLECSQDSKGEFQFKMTTAGRDAVRKLIGEITDE